MRGETEEVRKERWKGICGIQSCKLFEMAHVGKFKQNITSNTPTSGCITYGPVTIYRITTLNKRFFVSKI